MYIVDPLTEYLLKALIAMAPVLAAMECVVSSIHLHMKHSTACVLLELTSYLLFCYTVGQVLIMQFSYCIPTLFKQY